MSKAVPLIGVDDDRFVKYLPYFYYYEDGEYYYNIDGSISVLFEVTPPNKIYDKFYESVFNALVTFINRFYKDTVVQFFLLSSRGATHKHPVIQRYLSVKRRENLPKIVDECTRDRLNLFAQKEMFNADDGTVFSSRSITRMFAITVLPEKPKKSNDFLSFVFGSTKKEKERLEGIAEEQITRLNNIAKLVSDAFTMGGMKAQKVTPERFLDIMYPLLNGGEHRKVKGYDKLTPLREQVCNTPIEIDDSRIRIGEKFYNIVFVNAMSYTETDFLFKEDHNNVALADQLDDFYLTMNIYTNPVDEDMLHLSLKRRFSASFSRDSDDVRAQTMKEELDKVIADVSVNGKTLPNLTMTFLVEEKDADRLINALSLRGISCFKESDPMTLPMHLETLPFFYRKEHENVLQRKRKVYPEHVADLLPFYPMFQGSDKGKTHIYLDRRGNPVVIDLFKTTTAAHTVVLGRTGAGKSVFMNDFILQANREFCYTLVIDKGNSYKRNCELFNGKYIVLDPNKPTTMNPFYQFDPEDKDKLIFISSLLNFMAVGMNEKDYLTREKRGVLEQAVTEIADKIKDREITLSDLVEFLDNDYGEIGKELAKRIFPFTKKGRYGAFFDGENQFVIDNPFTVFEIGGVNDDELLTAWFMTTAYFYAQKIQSDELMGVSKYLIMDEVWRLMSMESAIGFFLEIVKTYRKYGASLITITQDFEDFFANRAGIAIFNNSPIKILLQNSANAIMSNAEKLLLTDWELNQYLSVKKTRNYSEAFVKLGDETSGIIRLTLTPQIYWIATTDDKDKALLNKYIQKYGDLDTAIEKIVENGGEEI